MSRIRRKYFVCYNSCFFPVVRVKTFIPVIGLNAPILLCYFICNIGINFETANREPPQKPLLRPPTNPETNMNNQEQHHK